MVQYRFANNFITSRKALAELNTQSLYQNGEAEGGCGVIGIACSEKIRGYHLLQSLKQMRNRGNGKGGGIAAVGLIPDELGVTREVLENDYLLTIAYLDSSSRQEVERKYIEPIFAVDYSRKISTVQDFNNIEGGTVLLLSIPFFF